MLPAYGDAARYNVSESRDISDEKHAESQSSPQQSSAVFFVYGLFASNNVSFEET